jgi:sugar O-acyltransferase (sialic acid O-acetyltransferase NeuD family)
MDIYIVGAGQHGEVVLDIVSSQNEHNVIGFLDDNVEAHGTKIWGIPVLGPTDLLDGPFVVAIGDNQARREKSEALRKRDFEAITVVHKTAYVAPSAQIGPGSMVCAGAMICISASIGVGAIINTGVVIDHHNIIGDYVHAAPRSVVAGRCVIGPGTMIGAGATIIHSINVGQESVIGAGSVVIRDVPSHTTVVGVPARP